MKRIKDETLDSKNRLIFDITDYFQADLGATPLKVAASLQFSEEGARCSMIEMTRCFALEVASNVAREYFFFTQIHLH